ncbi:MAG: hypothetical protein KatS3mg122_1389 [Caldimonas sp.]|nr:MAG: hypothetical protein KatS3mg122_1389 [Caldimonas sp.]
MGWLPAHRSCKPTHCRWCGMPRPPAMDPRTMWSDSLKSGALSMRCEDPDHPNNWPRNLFVWRSNLLGSSGKGHEYFLKHLLGTAHGVQGKDLGPDEANAEGSGLARAGARGQAGPAGHARLPHEHDLPLLGHRAAHGHLVRKERSQHQRHASLHPSAVCRRWTRCGQARSDWEIYKGIAKKFSEVCVGHLGVEKEWCSPRSCTTRRPSSPSPSMCRDWKKGECDLIPGKTAPQITVVERDYPNTYKRSPRWGR